MSCRVKICGITRPEDARCAVEAGADFLGLVFAPGSPRRVDLVALESWLEDVRDPAEVVGVFRDQPLEVVLEMVERFDLDFVQLHGREEGDAWKRLPVRMIEARVVHDAGLPPARFPGAAWAHLLDGGAGSGTGFDHALAVEPARAERVFLAGGLDPSNVAEAVRQVRPFAVDVATGVERSAGEKDHDAVRAFLRAVRTTDDPRERGRG